MNYETYLKTERPKYGEFANTVRSILESAVKEQSYLSLQQIQSRAKDPTSLWKKLQDRKLTETSTLEVDIKDLAGCRIIFYTNDDVSNFERSGIIHTNFEVDWDRTKFHYPMRDHRDSSWVYEVWYHKQAKSFFSSLSPDGAELVLDGLKFIEVIDHSSEYVLAYLGTSYPKIVFDFFGKRITHAKGPHVLRNYEAIPFDLNEIDKTLQEIADYAIDKAREWYAADASFQHHAVKLLHNSFPIFPKAFETKLLLVSASGLSEDFKFVVDVLLSYEGAESIWGACKELVNALPIEDELLGSIEMVLVRTEGTSGTFGLVQAYQEKKQRISQWLGDPRDKVRLFAEKFVLALDREIAAEQRRAEESLEMRKRGFDSIARAVE